MDHKFKNCNKKTEDTKAYTSTVVYYEDGWSISGFSNICLICETAVSSVHQYDLPWELQEGKALHVMNP